MQAWASESPALGFEPALQASPTTWAAWAAIVGLAVFSALCILVGAGGLLRLAFPVAALAVGVFLYRSYPLHYVGFTWWVWFLTPLLRRLVDYKSGWVDPSPMLLAPYLVTLVCSASLMRYISDPLRRDALPFLLTGVGVLYGFGTGMLQNPPREVVRALLDWLTPVAFGFYLFSNWRSYTQHRRTIERTFLWGVLVIGCYGVVQFFVAPAWDRFWLENVNELMESSFGKPEPYEMRVWSTLHGPAAFANVMMAGLLLLLNSAGALHLPATAFGYIAFLLSSVRAAWLGWGIGVLTLIPFLKPRLQARLILIIFVTALCVVPLTMIGPISEVVTYRLQSFLDLGNDGSRWERQENYNRWLDKAMTNFVGDGIGWKAKYNDALLDSAVLDLLLSLGWFGSFLYMGGMLLLVFKLFQGFGSPFDSFPYTARAIGLGMMAQLLLGSVMLGLAGMVLWGFLGISLAARNYYQHEGIAEYDADSR